MRCSTHRVSGGKEEVDELIADKVVVSASDVGEVLEQCHIFIIRTIFRLREGCRDVWFKEAPDIGRWLGVAVVEELEVRPHQPFDDAFDAPLLRRLKRMKKRAEMVACAQALC